MKRIQLTRELETIVDDQDFDVLVQYAWYAHLMRPSFYAARGVGGTILLMHRFLLNAKPGEVVDHLNRNSLDNRRTNIRIATRSINCHNRVKEFVNKTGFRGVSKACEPNKWVAWIRKDRKSHYLGYFASPELAAHAYDVAALSIYGEHAVTNYQMTARGGI